MKKLTVLFLGLLAAATLSAAPFARWFDFPGAGGKTYPIYGEGDEFSAWFEAEDGHAVGFNDAAKAYEYLKPQADGSLIGTGILVGDEAGHEAELAAIPLHARDTSAAHDEKVRARMEEFDRANQVTERWEDVKAKTTVRNMAEDVVTIPGVFMTPSWQTVETLVGATILVDFPGEDGTGRTLWQIKSPGITVADIDAWLNATDGTTKFGNYCSARQYYRDVSNNKFDYSQVIVGPYTMPHPRSYYDDPTKAEVNCADLLFADLKNISFSSEDRTKISKASDRGVNVIFAGPEAANWSKGLWAHMATASRTLGGRTFKRYNISPLGYSPVLYGFCHENGHMMCDFPDFYSYSGLSHNMVGTACLMAARANDRSPSVVSAYLRMHAGWVTPKDLRNYNNSYVTIERNVNDVYMYSNQNNDNEYYLIENRGGGHDGSMCGGGKGILIWHCNQKGGNTSVKERNPAFAAETDGSQYRISNFELTLEQADGLYNMERNQNSGDANDLWHSGNTAAGYPGEFTDLTVPTAKWMDNTASGLVLSEFSSNGGTMTFAVGTPVVEGAPTISDQITAAGYVGTGKLTVSNFGTGASSADVFVDIYGEATRKTLVASIQVATGLTSTSQKTYTFPLVADRTSQYVRFRVVNNLGKAAYGTLVEAANGKAGDSSGGWGTTGGNAFGQAVDAPSLTISGGGADGYAQWTSGDTTAKKEYMTAPDCLYFHGSSTSTRTLKSTISATVAGPGTFTFYASSKLSMNGNGSDKTLGNPQCSVVFTAKNSSGQQISTQTIPCTSTTKTSYKAYSVNLPSGNNTLTWEGSWKDEVASTWNVGNVYIDKFLLEKNVAATIPIAKITTSSLQPDRATVSAQVTDKAGESSVNVTSIVVSPNSDYSNPVHTGAPGAVTGLQPLTRYYVQATLTGASGETYPAIGSFVTPDWTKPTGSVTVSSVQHYSATVDVSVTNPGSENAADIVKTVTVARDSSFAEVVKNGASVPCDLTGLDAGTTYYVRGILTGPLTGDTYVETTFTTLSASYPLIGSVKSADVGTDRISVNVTVAGFGDGSSGGTVLVEAVAGGVVAASANGTASGVYELTGLDRDTSYTIRVTVTGSNGLSSTDESLVVKTLNVPVILADPKASIGEEGASATMSARVAFRESTVNDSNVKLYLTQAGGSETLAKTWNSYAQGDVLSFSADTEPNVDYTYRFVATTTWNSKNWTSEAAGEFRTEYYVTNDWLTVDFESYQVNSALPESDASGAWTKAVGGVYESASSVVDFASEFGKGKGLDQSGESTYAKYTATATRPDGIRCLFDADMYFTVCKVPPESLTDQVLATATTAIFLYSGDEANNFRVYTADGWKDVFAEGFEPASKTFHHVTIDVDYDVTPARVRFTVDGHLLADANGVKWFNRANQSKTDLLTAVSVYGNTKLDGFSAKMLEYGNTACQHVNKQQTSAAKEATCTEDGCTAGYVCPDCGRVWAAAVIPALGHAWNNGEITKPATYRETGVMTYTCTRAGCGATRTETIEKPVCPHAHTTVTGASAATCTTAGSTGTETCDDCDAIIHTASAIAALGHDWDEGVVTLEPTRTAEGIKTFTCKRAGCGATQTEPIPMLPNLAAMRNIAQVATVGQTLTLPAKVRGLKPDATLGDEYTVAWQQSSVKPTAEGVTTVTGTVTVSPLTFDVKATIRAVKVSNPDTTPANIAPNANGVSTSDVRYDGVLPTGSGKASTGAYSASAGDMTLTWTDDKIVSKAVIYFYSNKSSSQPTYSNVAFKNGTTAIDCSSPVSNKIYEKGNGSKDLCYQVTYNFTSPVTLSSLKITLPACQIEELEVYGTDVPTTATADPLTTDTLASLKVDNVAVPGFVSTTYSYTVTDGEAITDATATDNANMGITILPKDNEKAYVVTLAENGSTKTYTVSMPPSVVCTHEHTTVTGATDATCTAAGSTGTETCNDCHAVIREATVIPALGHDWSDWAVTKEASKTETGLRERNCQRVGCSAHEEEVIPMIVDIAALRNIAVVTAVGTAPTLPEKVAGLKADGTVGGEYDVVWSGVTAPSAAGITTVNGTATVNGAPMSVTASVRAAAAAGGPSVNLSPSASSATVVAYSKFTSAEALLKSDTPLADNQWQDYISNTDNNKSPNTTELTLGWDSSVTVSEVAIYFNGNGGNYQPPANVKFYDDSVSPSTEIAFTAGDVVDSGTVYAHIVYTFSNPKTLSKIRFYATPDPATNARILFIRRMWVYGPDTSAGGSVEPTTTDTLTALAVDGTPIAGFVPTTYNYSVDNGAVISSAVNTNDNVGITILPKYEGSAYVVTLAENGTATQKYTVAMPTVEICLHQHTSVTGAVAATCMVAGYTGDTVCDNCHVIVQKGSAISALGHDWSDWVTTKEPTTKEAGSKKRECQREGCDAEEVEEIPMLEGVTLTLDPKGGTVASTTVDLPAQSLPTPTREGYHFVGWFKDEIDADTTQGYVRGKYLCGEPLTAATADDEDKILYAKWVKNDVYSHFRGKKAVFVGDSVSTLHGYAAVNRQVYTSNIFYTEAKAAEQGITATNTWWGQLVQALDMSLLSVNAVAGSPVTDSEPSITYDVRAMSSTARIDDLDVNGTPDVIFIFGGINDFNGNTKAPIDDYDPNASYLTDELDLTSDYFPTFAEGYATMLRRMRHYYPDAEIVAIGPYIAASDRDAYKPVFIKGNTTISNLCARFNVPYLNLMNTQLPYWANGVKLLCDSYHPNQAGFTEFANYVLENYVPACAHEHKTALTGVVAATCTTDGYSGDCTCEDCGETILGHVITKLGHDWGEWVTKKEASETETGLKRRECQRSGCNAYEEQEIPMIVEIAALRNVAVVTAVGTAPTLPEKVAGLKADGTVSGEYEVSWSPASVPDSPGITTVTGTAQVNGVAMTVTASVRAAVAGGNLANVSPSSTLTSTDPQGAYLSEVVSADEPDPTGFKWMTVLRTNASDMTNTLTWNSSKTISKVRIAYSGHMNHSRPATVDFNTGAANIPMQETARETVGAHLWVEYTFSQPTAVTTLLCHFTRGSEVNSILVERIWAYEVQSGGSVDPTTTDTLTALAVDGNAVAGFAATTYGYTVTNGKTVSSAVNADDNVGITILQKSVTGSDNAYVVTLAENGTATQKYTVSMAAGEDPPVTGASVTLNANGGTVASTTVDLPAQSLPTPTREGYHFVGWFEDKTLTSYDFTPGGSYVQGTFLYGTPVTAPTADYADKTLYAKWVKTSVYEHFHGKKVAVYGDSVSTLLGFVPSAEADMFNGGVFYGQSYVDKGINEHTQWWGQLVDALGMQLLEINAIGGSSVGAYAYEYGLERKAMMNYTRMRLLDDAGTPDVIIVAAGINDYNDNTTGFNANADYLTNELDRVTSICPDFAKAYALMIRRLQDLYPATEIVALSSFDVGAAAATETGNDCIRRTCALYNVVNIDMRNAFTLNDGTGVDYRPHGIHPGISGFAAIANCFLENYAPIANPVVVPDCGHTWGFGVLTTPATATASGVRTYTCRHCAATRTEEVPYVALNEGTEADITSQATVKGVYLLPDDRQVAANTVDKQATPLASYNGYLESPANLIDGNADTIYKDWIMNDRYIAFTFDQPMVVTSVKLYGVMNRYPNKIQIVDSDNRLLGKTDGGIPYTSGQHQCTITTTERVATSELRLAVDFEYVGKEFQLKEVEIFGYAAGTEPPIDPPDDPVETEIVALRNVAVVTAVGTAPTLPEKVAGLKADGTVSGEYDVVWEPAAAPSAVGITTVVGTAQVNGAAMTVTASVRAVTVSAGGSGELVNVAPRASSLVATTPGTTKWDKDLVDLSAITNGWGANMVIGGWNTPGNNWRIYTQAGVDLSVNLDFTWAAPQKISKIFIATFDDNQVGTLVLKDGQTGNELVPSSHKIDQNDYYKINSGDGHLYIFDTPVTLSQLRIEAVKNTGGRWYGYYEIEIFAEDGGSEGGSIDPLTTDTLTALAVDGAVVAGFVPTTYAYTVTNGTAITSAVNANDNVGITILPKYDGSAYVVTLAENGTETQKYTVAMPTVVICTHEHTTVTGASDATCTGVGSTGTETCDDCHVVIREAEEIPALGHLWGEWQTTKEATETETGLKRRECQRDNCDAFEEQVIPKIAAIVALRNVAVVTAVGTAPELPSKVAGLKADGTVDGEYDVVWNSVSAPSAAGITMVNGTAQVNGAPMTVTASVRAADAPTGDIELINIAPLASSMTVDYGRPSTRNGEPANITNCWAGSTMVIGAWNTPSTSLNCYWDKGGEGDGYLVTFDWPSSRRIKKIRVANNDNPGAQPVYLWNGSEQITSFQHTRNADSYYKISSGSMHEYQFESPLELSSLKVECRTTGIGLALYQIEVWAEDEGTGGTVDPLTTDTLSALAVDGNAVAGFAPTTYSYTVENGTAITSATSTDNVGITILPKYEGSAYVVTLAENGTATKKYTVAMPAAVPQATVKIVDRSGKETTVTKPLDEIVDAINSAVASASFGSKVVLPALDTDYTVTLAPGVRVVKNADSTGTVSLVIPSAKSGWYVLNEAGDAMKLSEGAKPFVTDIQVADGASVVTIGNVKVDLYYAVIKSETLFGFETASVVATSGKIASGETFVFELPHGENEPQAFYKIVVTDDPAKKDDPRGGGGGEEGGDDDPVTVDITQYTWCSLGTSITDFNDDPTTGRTKGYQFFLMDELGWDRSKLINEGHSGTLVSSSSSKPPATPCDIYTVEYGVNDWGTGHPVGTLDDYKNYLYNGKAVRWNNFASCYRNLIEMIKAVNPNAVIVLITPRKAYGSSSDAGTKMFPANCDDPTLSESVGDYYDPQQGTNVHGDQTYLKDYADLIKAIGAYEGFPVVDWYSSAATQANLASLSVDNAVHPNDAGYEIMAGLLKPVLLKAVQDKFGEGGGEGDEEDDDDDDPVRSAEYGPWNIQVMDPTHIVMQFDGNYGVEKNYVESGVFSTAPLSTDYALIKSASFTVNGTVTAQAGHAIAARGQMSYTNAQGQAEIVGGNNSQWEIRAVHNLYLNLASSLVEGTNTVVTPDERTLKFVYNAKTVSPLFKVNQVGYAASAAEKYVYLGGWMGTAGTFPLDDSYSFEVVNASSGATALTGSFTTRMNDPTSGGVAMTGEKTLEADISALTTAGTYYVRVNGLGRSMDFRVSDDAAADQFAVHMLGLYQQRCGCAKEEPYTHWTDSCCHQKVYRGVHPSNDDEYEKCFGGTAQSAFSIISANAASCTEQLSIIGGWHDAADYDRRPYHLQVVVDLANAYLMKPANFTDGQLAVPEKNNGIPDILDEADWGLKFYLAAQQQDDGGVGGWAETVTHPDYGNKKMPSDDTYKLQYYLGRATRRSTLKYCGAAANLARALYAAGTSQATARADVYKASAVKAWNYVMNSPRQQNIEMKGPNGSTVKYTEPAWYDPYEYAKAAINLGVITGDPTYFNHLSDNITYRGGGKDNYNYGDTGPYPVSGFFSVDWSCISRDESYGRTGFILSELGLPCAADDSNAAYHAAYQTIKTGWINRVKANADEIITSMSSMMAYRNGALSAKAWGASGSLRNAEWLCAAHFFTGDAKYLKAAQLASDYQSGCNPLGMTWTSGLGKIYPVAFLSLHSFADSIAEYVPGITPFYNTGSDFGYLFNNTTMTGRYTNYQAETKAKPLWRRFEVGENMSIGISEYTVTETIGPCAAASGYLINAGHTTANLNWRQPAAKLSDLPGYWALP